MTQPRITAIDVYRSDIRLVTPFRIAVMETTHAENVFVRIRTDDGSSGFGEASPTPALTGETQAIDAAAAVDLARLLLGKDPLDIESRVGELERFLAHNTAVRSAFDMALYDLAGKAAGLPLYALLGGPRRLLVTDLTVFLDTPARMAEEAARMRELALPAIKVKLGTTEAEDIARIARIRERIGDELPLRIDANQGWDFPTAARVLRRLESRGIEYCEQPLARWDLDNLRRLRRRTAIPIMADESLFDHHDAFKLAALGCCDLFNIKLSKSGGIHAALKINAVAEACGVACMVGCMMESRLGLTAAAHLVSARPNIRYADLDSHFLLAEDPIVGGAAYDGGEITLPDAPGIGAEVDPAFLGRCERITVG